MVRIEASTQEGQVACPSCGTLSGRVHSRYERRLSDTAVAGREMLIRLRVRRSHPYQLADAVVGPALG